MIIIWILRFSKNNYSSHQKLFKTFQNFIHLYSIFISKDLIFTLFILILDLFWLKKNITSYLSIFSLNLFVHNMFFLCKNWFCFYQIFSLYSTLKFHIIRIFKKKLIHLFIEKIRISFYHQMIKKNCDAISFAR